MENKFREHLLNKAAFTVSLELSSGRGGREAAQENTVATAKWAAADSRISAVSVTDSPGGRPGTPSSSLAAEIKGFGIEPIIHYTLKDKNRLAIESDFYGFDRAGLHNLLIMTGDFPKKGYFYGTAKPVFDLDPIHGLDLVYEMNQGLKLNEQNTLKATDFFAGCVVTPFKNVEAEIITEYIKLDKKIKAHAGFVISQVGYDMRKFHELRQLFNEKYPGVPLMGNLFFLNKNLAGLIYRHLLTGCAIPQKLYDEMMAAPDDGKERGLLRAAQMYGIMKGMGYDGVHLGGEKLCAGDVDFVLSRGEEFAADWENQLDSFAGFDDGAFYYYRHNPVNGLNLAERTNLETLPASGQLTRKYRLLRKLHDHIYEKDGLTSKWAARFGRRAAKGGFSRKLERSARSWVLQCMDCGDCGLAFTDLICPMTQCPKQQRNGPCGGSRNGFCELYPNKRACIYVTAYNRLKVQNKTEILEWKAPPPNCSLYGTSEWNNFFMNRDAYSKLKKQRRSQ